MIVKQTEADSGERIDLENPNSKYRCKFTTFSDKTALSHLKDLCLAEHRKRFPEWPEHYHNAPSFQAKTTNGLSRCIIHFLKLKGHHIERTGNEGRIIDTRQVVTDVIGKQRVIGSLTRIKGSGTKGTSDLKAVINGRFVAIEVKNGNTSDRQSNVQKLYQLGVERSGGIYIIASSLGQFVSWYYSKFGR